MNLVPFNYDSHHKPCQIIFSNYPREYSIGSASPFTARTMAVELPARLIEHIAGWLYVELPLFNSGQVR